MIDLDLCIQDVRDAMGVLTAVVEQLITRVSPSVSTSPLVTLESVRAVLAEKSRAGHTDAIRALLEKHGASKLSGINPANYAALLADAEVLGDG